MFERTIRNVLENASKAFPIVLLTGQRQVGKSFLVRNLSENINPPRKYITLDDLNARQAAKEDPKKFIQDNPPPIIIDEVQYAPELFPYIKIWADERQYDYMAHNNSAANPNGAFWLTGSQSFNLMQGVQESMAGRVCIINLFGLSYKESIGKSFAFKPFLPSSDMLNREPICAPLSPNQAFEKIWQGSFPKLIDDNSIDRKDFYDSYIQTYISRDVRDFYKINNQIAFNNFIIAVAARTGELLNLDNLATTARIDNRTAKLWLEILVRSGLIYLLYPYYANINKRIVKTPKVFFMDTGLSSYLTNWNTPDNLRVGAQSGHILETYVFGEIMKSYLHNGKQP
ncbi:MAG: ATP-binding protein, partial [Elusimicrobiota bacterium]|nr:ATP-binding protein [Elusimicrobiota bacterium]